MSRVTQRRMVLTGNHASAYAVLQARVDIVSAYPITPQTTIVEKLDEYIENGLLDAKMIRVESEHSAMGAAIGASMAGARTYTATSSHGLLYMYENLWWAANARLPIVATFVTRAIGPPWNIWSDHQDIFTLRDTGWILFMAKDCQEVYDLTIQAFKIAEDPSVRLPVGVGYDGFLISHTSEPLDTLLQEDVDRFLPDKSRIKPLIDPDNPVSIGNLPQAEYNYILRKNMWDSMVSSIDVIRRVGREYGEISGRDYSRLLDHYKCRDADTVFVSMGAMAGEGISAVEYLRDKGFSVGHISFRLVRPFPRDEFISSIDGVDRIIIFSRAYTCGKSGILYDEIASELYRRGMEVEVYDVVAGLTGAEVSMGDFIKVYMDIRDGSIKPGETIFILGGRYV